MANFQGERLAMAHGALRRACEGDDALAGTDEIMKEIIGRSFGL